MEFHVCLLFVILIWNDENTLYNSYGRALGVVLRTRTGRNGDVWNCLYRRLCGIMDSGGGSDMLQKMLRQMLLLLAMLQEVQRFVSLVLPVIEQNLLHRTPE